MNKIWGYHLILDIAKCKPNLIRCSHNITAFSTDLVKRIDMVAYGKPQVVHFGSDDKAGYTLVQLIETSNITGHFVEENNSAYLDVFSCKKYDIETVVETVNEYFKPEYVVRRYFERYAPENKYLK